MAVAGRPWRGSIPSDSSVFPEDLIAAGQVDAQQWVRIAPYAFSEFEVFSRDCHLPSPPPPPWVTEPPNPSLKLDYKVVPRHDFFGDGAGLFCTEVVLRALTRLGVSGWSASPVVHASPHPVRGSRLYGLQLPGRLGAPTSTMNLIRPAAASNCPVGVPGTPLPPVTFDASAWSGDPVCVSEWLKVDTNNPYRALLARGDFVQALLAEGASDSLLLQPVELVNLPASPLPARPAAVMLQVAPSWPRPTTFTGSAHSRIAATAPHYRHFLPPPPQPEELRRVATEVEQRYGGSLGSELLSFMAATNGAALFAGMLTFFPIGARTEENSNVIPHWFACDDLAGANERVGPDDWLITRAPGWILFASRYNEMHAMWAINPKGIVRLLHQSGEVLGPDLPFEAWLEDQVADLEWAWDHPEAFQQFNRWIDLSPSEGWSF
ncbi:MAG: hypothetical protein EOO73_09015 [Myxococcales bacterium]|nr:MAG: hypothetical protein EOO73_09015 [Myxococcales bacterium]